MTAGTNLQAGLADQLRPTPFAPPRALGKASEHIKLRHCLRHCLQRAEIGGDAIEQCFIELFLARQSAIASRQHLILELLEFLGDVTLEIGQRLAPRVVGRDLVRVRLAGFKVMTGDAVVADFKGLDAGALAFAGFEFDEKEIGRASCRERVCNTFRYRWSPYN